VRARFEIRRQATGEVGAVSHEPQFKHMPFFSLPVFGEGGVGPFPLRSAC